MGTGCMYTRDESYEYTMCVERTNTMGTRCMYKVPILWVHDGPI